MTKAKIERIAEKLGWNVSWEKQGNKKYATFQKYSPYGQDFFFDVYYKNLDEVAVKIYEYYEDFDPSEEASLWLDETGHGKNNAPYKMGDVYKDMCDCEKMIEELYDALVA